MSKRNPTSVLNHDNWDQEDEKEDAGHFQAAPEDVLKKREIRVAKRRTLGSEDKGTGGLFKSFTGFTGGGSESGCGSSSGVGASLAVSFNFAASTAVSKPATSTAAASAADPNAAHLAQLKSLNESVLRWIQSHVTATPHCVLTPVFRDYERHLADIERRHPYMEAATAATGEATTSSAATAAPMPPTFSFSATGTAAAAAATSKSAASSVTVPTSTLSSTTTATSATSMPPTFSFNFAAAKSSTESTTTSTTSATTSAVASAAAKTTAAFFFGSTAAATTTTSATSTTTPAMPAFTFGAGPPASASSLFGAGSFLGSGPLAAASSSAGGGAAAAEEDDEEYVPPKPETREIREDGAVFSQRCKLFYMAEGKEWREKGVGTVHVKPVESGAGGRAQLVIRADNTLGTILLNALVTKEMTLTVTKNNLSLACVPNPPLPKTPKSPATPGLVPFLVRLKVESDAKELLAKIDQLRGSN